MGGKKRDVRFLLSNLDFTVTERVCLLLDNYKHQQEMWKLNSTRKFPRGRFPSKQKVNKEFTYQ